MKLITTMIVAMATTFALGTTASAERGKERRAPSIVYVLSNATEENKVLELERGPDGAFTVTEMFATGGRGSGDGLGSQGSLILSDNEQLLFAVNAASNDVSVFIVGRRGLQLFDRVPSGGELPVSLAYRDGVLYVLNAGGSGNISGFRLTFRGLKPISGSIRALSGSQTAPAQIAFDPSSGDLVVTERATNQILIYPVDRRGRAGAPVIHASVGVTPFGFAFASQSNAFGYDADYLIVSEAAGGAAGASTASSYRVDGTDLEAVTAAAPTGQAAACWAVASRNGRFVYVANTGSDTISGFAVGTDGSLSLLDSSGASATTGDRPSESVINGSGKELFVLNAGSDSLSVFEINRDGSLEPAAEITGLPASAVGIAAR